MRMAMRFLISGLALLGLMREAPAADYEPPVMRGSESYRPLAPTYRNWSGFYFGGQLGYSSGTASLSSINTPYVNPLLGQTIITGAFSPLAADWGALGDGHSNSTPVGGFVGYNWQSDNAVYGIELNYNRFGKMSMSQTDSMDRTVTDADAYDYDIFSTRRVAVKMMDAVSMRMKAGAVYGQFLPYLSLGVAAARMSVTSTATAGHNGGINPDPITFPNIAPVSVSASVEKKGAIALGISAGLGLDYEVMPHVFLRGEYEYLGFAAVEGVNTSVHTARVGVGLRF